MPLDNMTFDDKIIFKGTFDKMTLCKMSYVKMPVGIGNNEIGLNNTRQNDI
jgi:hypothetical protein